MKIESVLFLFGVILLISLASPAGYVGDGRQVDQYTSIQFGVSYVEHSRIVITSDLEFAAQAQAEDWGGDGSSTTPYIIEGYNITDDQTCIQVTDVSVYFTVRNCFVNSSTAAADPGIFLYNASHARVEETVSTWHTYGIYANLCPDVMIHNCTVTESNAMTIWIIDSNRAVLSGCKVYDNMYRIYVQNSDYVLIQGNEIHDNDWEGLRVESSDFVNITGNTIANNSPASDFTGVLLDFCNNVTVQNNEVYRNGDAGIYVGDSHNTTVSGNIVYQNGLVSSVSGIMVYNSHNSSIVENQVYDNAAKGVQLWQSYYGRIQGNSIYRNAEGGIHLTSNSHDTEVRDNQVWENGFWVSTPMQAGVVVESSLYCVIEENSIWNNTQAGVSLINEADYNDVVDNLIWNNTQHGIYAYDAFYIDVIGNDIWGNGWESSGPTCGIHASSCLGWLIEGNSIWNNTEDGVFFDGWMGVTRIVDNEVYDNSRHGITLFNGGPYVVDGNTIHHNGNTGIFVNVDSYANITDNVVYDNLLGVYIMFGSTGWIYGNDIGWNTLGNALDMAGPDANCWHDNESIGNWWSDYSGVGPYGITNSTSFESYDLYPHKSLDLNASTSLGYEFGTTGNVMVWPAQALNPSHFEVYANGSLLYSEPWDGSDIEANLDGLDVGFHDIMLIAYHISGHSVNATSSVTVSDTTGPAWVTVPTNQEIEVGESFSYQVTATDLSGIGSYSVNDTVHFKISATGLITNMVPLEVGVYGLEITVVDIYGNELTKVITVTVLSGPPVDSPVLLAIAGIGAIVVVLVLVMFVKKRAG